MTVMFLGNIASVVVRAHDEQAVFDRDGDDQGPDDQRQDPERTLRREPPTGGLHDGLKRVERAGTQNAVETMPSAVSAAQR